MWTNYRIKTLNYNINKILKTLYNTRENDDDEVDEEWGNIKNSISKAVKTVKGIRKYKKNEEWFDQDCVLAIQPKKNMKKKGK